MITHSAPSTKLSPPGDAPKTGLDARLLAWYDQHKRALPWRALPGEQVDPYRVWLSEIMLQQTTVEAVKPYFARFLTLWPDVKALAQAEDQALFSAWAGLGYYARARNLLACSRQILAQYGGVFPQDEVLLRALPGIGEYTAAAITAIAFGKYALVVDGNVERVITRLAAIATPLPKAKPEIKAVLAQIAPLARSGDFAQAIMDLGATICTPRNPSCVLCPWQEACSAHHAGEPMHYPVKPTKKKRPIRFGAAFVAVDPVGRILLRTRPDKGLLAKMSEVPGSLWSEDPQAGDSQADAPFKADWRRIELPIIHVFTHFELRLTVYTAISGQHAAPPASRWVGENALANEPIPTLFVKVIKAATS